MTTYYRLDTRTLLVLSESATLAGIAVRHPRLPTAIPSIHGHQMSEQGTVVAERWLGEAHGGSPVSVPWTAPGGQKPVGWVVAERRFLLSTGQLEERAVLARTMQLEVNVNFTLNQKTKQNCFEAITADLQPNRGGLLHLIFVPVNHTPTVYKPFQGGQVTLHLRNDAVGFLTVACKVDAVYALGKVWPIAQGIQALPNPTFDRDEINLVYKALNPLGGFIAPRRAREFLDRARKAQALIGPAPWPDDRIAAVQQYRAWLLQWATKQLSDEELARRARYLYRP